MKERWGPPSERWTISGDDDVAYLYHVGPYWTLNVYLDPGEDRALTLGLSPSLIGRQEKHATIPSGER